MTSSPTHERTSTRRIILGRLLIGWVVLICAEGLSGASLRIGFWSPWTLLVTYWLYFGHFFFFTTLAIRTGKTMLPALYLWGVLLGLYESWITKVIWSGYDGNGHFAMGKIGPYGYSEISVVFLFHPVMSFILPLCVACILAPSLRRYFPQLAWFSGTTRWARAVRVYLLIATVSVMAMNSGGPINYAVNVVLIAVLASLLYRGGRPALNSHGARNVLEFGRKGFLGLCVYLALLYALTYFKLRPNDLPSAEVQMFTFVFYAILIAGLYRAPRDEFTVEFPVQAHERNLAIRLLGSTVAASCVASFFSGFGILEFAVMPHFILWTPLGFLLTVMAFAKCVRSSRCHAP